MCNGRSEEIKALSHAIKESLAEDERAGLICVMDDLKSKRRSLVRAERRKKARNKFYVNPFAAAKDILTPKCKCEPKVSNEVLNAYLLGVSSDPQRDAELYPLPELQGKREPMKDFKGGRFKINEFEEILKMKRNAS